MGSNGYPASVPPMIMPAHGLVRYCRTKVEVDDGVVRWEMPRTLLGVLPVGTRGVAVPVADVSSIRIDRIVRWLDLAIGLSLMIVPWFFFSWWASSMLLIFGLWVVLVSLGPELEIKTRSGEKHGAAVCPGHQLDAELYIAAVEDLAGLPRQS